ncbi:MAG: DMP19 family protein [Spirochaetes bacterium]|nr:DMP19 family protein [Spirochaetota bacterium]
MKGALPEIKAQDLKNAQDAWDFLYVILGKYFEMMQKDEKIKEEFSDAQITLVAYRHFDDQVCNGGFLQLVQNGLGGIIYDKTFSQTIKSWGAGETAAIAEEAGTICAKHKEKLDRLTMLQQEFSAAASEVYHNDKKAYEKLEARHHEEVSKFYDDFEDFEPLEDRYYEIMEREVEKVKAYVEKNISEFAVVT